MELTLRLTNLKKKVMKKIANAAMADDTRSVTAYSDLANRIEQDVVSLNAVEKRLYTYEKALAEAPPLSLPTMSIDGANRRSKQSGGYKQNGGREIGYEARKALAEAGETRGYTLLPLTRSAYKTRSGEKVVIPFANEQRPNRWFLGIEDDHCDVAVLLCREGNGVTREFVLPREFLEKFWRSFSRSGGQIKLNVARSGVNWLLLVPGHDSESLNPYLSNYTPLKD